MNFIIHNSLCLIVEGSITCEHSVLYRFLRARQVLKTVSFQLCPLNSNFVSVKFEKF